MLHLLSIFCSNYSIDVNFEHAKPLILRGIRVSSAPVPGELRGGRVDPSQFWPQALPYFPGDRSYYHRDLSTMSRDSRSGKQSAFAEAFETPSFTGRLLQKDTPGVAEVVRQGAQQQRYFILSKGIDGPGPTAWKLAPVGHL